MPQIIGCVGFDETHQVNLPKGTKIPPVFEMLLQWCLRRNPKERITFDQIVVVLAKVRQVYERAGGLIRARQPKTQPILPRLKRRRLIFG